MCEEIWVDEKCEDHSGEYVGKKTSSGTIALIWILLACFCCITCFFCWNEHCKIRCEKAKEKRKIRKLAIEQMKKNKVGVEPDNWSFSKFSDSESDLSFEKKLPTQSIQ